MDQHVGQPEQNFLLLAQVGHVFLDRLVHRVDDQFVGPVTHVPLEAQLGIVVFARRCRPLPFSEGGLDILDQLEEDGLAENTVVFFFADNGRLEARGIHWVWDSGLHVPMILRWPKDYPAPEGYQPGRVSDRLISLIDLTATTLSIAGVEPPPLMHGRVFLGEQADPPRTFVFGARDRIDATEMRLRSVHGKQYHYISNCTPGAGFPTMNRYKEKCFPVKPLMRRLHAEDKLEGPAKELMQPFPKELLYDTQNDPHEIRNLADSDEPRHRQALIGMRAALRTWITETGDLGHLPEPAERVNAVEQRMHEWFGTPEWFNERY
jgi:arylsulfatase A-like enzyme